MVIDLFSMILLPVMINIVTAPIDAKNLLGRFQNRPKPINHDLQKAIKIAYLQALIEIATECQAGKIKSFRIYLPTEIDKRIKQWQSELKQVENAKEETEISPPFQDAAEIEQLLLSHGQPIGDRLKELETRLIRQALQGIADIPADYQNQIQTGLFARIYAHFVEQLKTNDRAYRAFELEYLPAINASLTEIGVGQEQVALTMTDMFSVVNRTDQNVQKIIDILNPKSLTLEDWQEICRQNLAQQKKFTTKEFQRHGAELQLDDIYVPLAIVERKPPKPPSKNQQEEKEEEKLIPITEERFFEDVLRQGKSEISQGRKIAIIGEPGSGKTTRLQKIADWILEQDLGLPIWISLADLTQPTITQYIEEIWLKQTGQNLTIEELTQQKHRIWLLLDGLDEMTSRVEMRHVSALLGGWVQAARVVVTCRVNVWEADKNAFSGFDVFRNLEFNPEQVTDYIRRWFAGMGDAATGESLEAALAESENSRLKELIQNPLRLWMLCQIWQTGGGLPETQAGLYGQFVDWVYDWKADEEILDQREAIDTALARLALAAMEQKDEVSRLRLRESWVLKVLGSRPIFQAVMKLGWLNRVERLPEAICVFYHAAFQEYFAALAVEDWDYFLPRNHVNFPVAGKEYRIFEPQWKQVILLWLGCEDVVDEDKEGFIQALVKFEDGSMGLYWFHAVFLAAAGIGEFKTCAQVDVVNAIVKLIVKWGFGYYNQEKQEWWGYFHQIQEDARETILQTDHKRAVQELYQILEHPQCHEYPRRLAVYTLREIGQGNQTAIAGLVKILETAEEAYTRMEAASCLCKIGQGNQTAIAELVRIIETTEDEYTRQRTAENLGEIDPGNQTAIADLVQILEKTEYTRSEAAYNLHTIGGPLTQVVLDDSTDYESTRMEAAKSLWEIDPGNQTAITALVKVIETTEGTYTRKEAAKSLWEIDPGNQTAITALVKVIETTEDEWTRMEAAKSLWEIDPGNQTVIAALVKVIETTEDEWTRMDAVESLCKIDPGNQTAIAELLRILETTGTQWSRRRSADSLKQIGQGNQTVIAELLRILKATEDEDTRIEVAFCLGKIDPGNQTAISELLRDPQLLRIFEAIEDENTHWQATESLEEIDPGNETENAELLRILETAENESTHRRAAYSLEKILTTRQHYAGVISALKHNLSDEVYQNNFDRFHECYKVLWDCAANLPYPEFYQAWHGLTETQTSPLVQTLNLAQLPQLLQTQLTETNLHQTLQLLCIDGSKFDNPDNPAADIYLQLVKKHHYPKSTEGTPRTLTELKIYWQLLDWEKHPILIFYEEAKPQGFSQTFLDFLTRFDATICVITDSPHATIPTFSPQDPHLIQTIMTWLQRTILET